jgi:hypothetical protein
VARRERGELLHAEGSEAGQTWRQAANLRPQDRPSPGWYLIASGCSADSAVVALRAVACSRVPPTTSRMSRRERRSRREEVHLAIGRVAALARQPASRRAPKQLAASGANPRPKLGAFLASAPTGVRPTGSCSDRSLSRSGIVRCCHTVTREH